MKTVEARIFGASSNQFFLIMVYLSLKGFEVSFIRISPFPLVQHLCSFLLFFLLASCVDESLVLPN